MSAYTLTCGDICMYPSTMNPCEHVLTDASLAAHLSLLSFAYYSLHGRSMADSMDAADYKWETLI